MASRRPRAVARPPPQRHQAGGADRDAARRGGATIDEIVAALEWQPHTARGAISGALKKKLGLTITSEKVDGRGRAYRITEG